MGYWLEVDVDASTAKADAEEDTAKIYRGVITKLFIMQSPGSAALCYFRVLVAGHQIFPVGPGKWFHWDNVQQSFDIFYDLRKGPTTLKLQAYNDDATYSHKVAVLVTVMPRWIAFPQIAVDNLRRAMDYLRRVLGGG